MITNNKERADGNVGELVQGLLQKVLGLVVVVLGEENRSIADAAFTKPVEVLQLEISLGRLLEEHLCFSCELHVGWRVVRDADCRVVQI